MEAARESDSNPFSWLSTLIMALDLNFLITFFYNQFRRLPSLKQEFAGKTIIVTGANVGLGLEAARHFARLGASKVILACRNTEKGERAKISIEQSTARSGVVEVWSLDLSSFESVKQFCRRADQLPRLDVVVENAAVAMVGPQGSLAEGYEQTITANFKERTAPKVFEAFKTPTVAPDRYQTSKLLEIFLVRQLAQEMSKQSSNSKGIILNTLNPGFCRTALFRDNKFPASVFLAFTSRLIGRSAEAGSRVIVDAAAAGPETHGQWMDTFKIREPSAYVRSDEGQKMQQKLYDELMIILNQTEPGITRYV